MSNMNQNNNSSQPIASMQSQLAAYTFDLASNTLNAFGNYFPESHAKMQKLVSDGIIEAIIAGLKGAHSATGTFSTNGSDDLISLLLIIANEKNDKKIEDIVKIIYPDRVQEFKNYMDMASDMRNKSLLATIALFGVTQIVSPAVLLPAVLLPAVLSTAATIALSSPSIVNKEDFRARLKQEFSTANLSTEGKIKHTAHLALLEGANVAAKTIGATQKMAIPITNKAAEYLKYGFNTLKSGLSQVAQGAKAAANKTTKGVKAAANTTTQGVKAAANTTTQGVKAAANTTAQGVKAAATTTAQGVKAATNTTAQGVKAAANTTAQGVKAAAAETKQTIKQTVERMKNFKPNPLKTLKDANDVSKNRPKN